MKKKTVGENPMKPTSLGIIVGRFQFDTLPIGVIENILKVMSENSHIAFILCNSNIKCTASNPLDFRARQRMITESLESHPKPYSVERSGMLGDIHFCYVNDSHSDEIWSKNVDKNVIDLVRKYKNIERINLYGSQENFVNHFHSDLTDQVFPCCFKVSALDSSVYLSVAKIKKQVLSVNPSLEFRSGMIASSLQRYPVSYQTVDVAVINRQTNKILLVRKPDEQSFRFIGGFADPDSMSLEDDAEREVSEETGVKVNNIKYLASTRVDDWRYRNEVDKIKTALFIADYVSGTPKGADDVAEAAWFDLSHFCSPEFVIQETHQVLRNLFIKHFN
jgi:bifunctional NMN adenylyltransferase/nudix hydrolase